MMKDIQDLYQNDPDFKHYVDHWAAKDHTEPEVVMKRKITHLVAEQYLNKEEEKKYAYEIRQDNGI